MTIDLSDCHLELSEPALSLDQRFRLIEISHETKDQNIRTAALGLLGRFAGIQNMVISTQVFSYYPTLDPDVIDLLTPPPGMSKGLVSVKYLREKIRGQFGP